MLQLAYLASCVGALSLQGARVVRPAPTMMSASSSSVADFAIVGCGLPGRGMGWFHGLQLVESVCPSARLTDVVEPWFLGGGRDSDAGRAFEADCVVEWSERGVRFGAALEAGTTWADGGPCRVALIAGRTVDNPKLFRDAIEAGATHILLEKPGAPSVAELEAMAAFAEERSVPVYMGFIKNIAAYVETALAASEPGSLVVFESLNAYTESELGECFARNSEGMLKNMAIHELALAVTYFGCRADNIARVKDVEGDLRTVGEFTDFKNVAFTLETEEGKAVRIQADRCGGDGCSASVLDPEGTVLARFDMVDAARADAVAQRQAQHPDWISYLLTQEDEYQDLKERCARAALAGDFPAGVATIHTAIEALKLAEYLTPLLKHQLNAKANPAPTANDAPVKAR